MYVGDRWDAKHYSNSSYIFLPITFKNETSLELNWTPKLIPNLKNGQLLTEN